MPKPKTKLQRALLWLAITAIDPSVAKTDFGWVAVGGAPSEYGDEAWNAFFDNPDASATYPITGYNISLPFPQNETVDGWTAEIQVANITSGEGSPYPGTNIIIRAPEGMKVPVGNDSDGINYWGGGDWEPCIAVLSPKLFADNAADDGQEDDGSCNSFLSEQCIDDLKTEVNGYHSKGSGGCTELPSIPVSCGSQTTNQVHEYGTGIRDNFTIFREGNTFFASRPDVEEGKDADDVYAKSIREIWFLAINWGHMNRSMLFGEDPKPVVACLRASNVSESSVNSDDSISAASLAEFGVGFTAVLLASLYMLL